MIRVVIDLDFEDLPIVNDLGNYETESFDEVPGEKISES